MARRALGPATLAVVQAVDVALASGDRSVLVACSGGPDSLALAAATQHVAQRRGIAPGAVVVDHGLQAGSAEVADRVRDQLQRLGYVEVAVRPVAVGRDGGPEAAARDARYAALLAVAETTDAVVLLGHTLDDQAESVLLGLARGSGPRSLAGMAPRADRLVRPLLGLRRATTEAACAELGLVAWTDPHNTDPRYARVRVRQVVLPTLEAELGPGIAEALARTAALSRADADLLDALAAEADPGLAELPVSLLRDLPTPLRDRVIRRWLTRHGAVDLSLFQVGRVVTLVTGWHGQGPLDLPGLAVERTGGSLRVRR